MRTSTTILRKIEHLLTSPGWAYCTIWRFAMMPPLMRAVPQGQPRRGSNR